MNVIIEKKFKWIQTLYKNKRWIIKSLGYVIPLGQIFIKDFEIFDLIIIVKTSASKNMPVDIPYNKCLYIWKSD